MLGSCHGPCGSPRPGGAGVDTRRGGCNSHRHALSNSRQCVEYLSTPHSERLLLTTAMLLETTARDFKMCPLCLWSEQTRVEGCHRKTPDRSLSWYRPRVLSQRVRCASRLSKRVSRATRASLEQHLHHSILVIVHGVRQRRAPILRRRGGGQHCSVMRVHSRGSKATNPQP